MTTGSTHIVGMTFSIMAAVFIIALAAIFLKEPLTRSRILATLLAVSGAILTATTIQ